MPTPYNAGYTAEDIRELAMAFLGEFGIVGTNVAKSVQYLRISSRQREIFTLGSSMDPEYFGECVVVNLDNEGANLNALEAMAPDTIYPIDMVQVVKIEDPGSSEYEAGEKVTIVRLDDPRALPPRMTLRSMILRGVDDDMTGVTSIKIWYSRKPWELGKDGTGIIELPEPFHDLLALDLAKFLVSRDKEGPNAAKALEYLTAQEATRMEAFKAHIAGTYRALESRFG